MHIIFRNGLNAAKKNIGPGLLLQGLALALVLLYYFHPPTRQMLLEVPKIRQATGFLFPLLATALFGGLIPFLFLAVRKKIAAGRYISELLFMLGFWAITGLAIDSLYQAQSVLFGDQVDAATIIKKVVVDQFVFSVFWSAPFAIVTMHWKNCGFSFQAAIKSFSRKQFLIKLPSILLALWAVWIPTVAIVYCLPPALQFPLVNIVLCFWSLLLTALNSGENNEIDC
ncbi:MAG: hypothetical protein HOO88_07105 [Kiritimatiellaceae bacterium]|nr:hypothetical protein [Kiritimatiellaceae bacterium]